jgi:hypothetical protein
MGRQESQKMLITYVAWDFGIVSDSASKILGFRPEQKTTKTLCKKRVRMKNINNTQPTCPSCLESLRSDPVYGESIEKANQ